MHILSRFPSCPRNPPLPSHSLPCFFLPPFTRRRSVQCGVCTLAQMNETNEMTSATLLKRKKMPLLRARTHTHTHRHRHTQTHTDTHRHTRIRAPGMLLSYFACSCFRSWLDRLHHTRRRYVIAWVKEGQSGCCVPTTDVCPCFVSLLCIRLQLRRLC